jgi:hypothetical protein
VPALKFCIERRRTALQFIVEFIVGVSPLTFVSLYSKSYTAKPNQEAPKYTTISLSTILNDAVSSMPNRNTVLDSIKLKVSFIRQGFDSAAEDLDEAKG